MESPRVKLNFTFSQEKSLKINEVEKVFTFSFALACTEGYWGADNQFYILSLRLLFCFPNQVRHKQSTSLKFKYL